MRDYMSSYVGYLRDECIIALLSWNAIQFKIVQVEGRQQQQDGVCTLHFEHLSKKGAKAGYCALDRTMKWMGSNLYANCFSDNRSCVFERFVIFAFRKDYLANHVQKLR